MEKLNDFLEQLYDYSEDVLWEDEYGTKLSFGVTNMRGGERGIIFKIGRTRQAVVDIQSAKDIVRYLNRIIKIAQE